jgi:hypothetical protein
MHHMITSQPLSSSRLLPLTSSLSIHPHPQPLLPLTIWMITTKPILIIHHSLRSSRTHPQLVGKPPKHRPHHNINLRICQRHTHTLPRAPSKRHHIAVQAIRLLDTLQPALGVKSHWVREDFGIAVHHPRGHADDGAGGDEVVVKRGAGVGNDAREAADDAEGEAEGFFDYGGLWWRLANVLQVEM